VAEGRTDTHVLVVKNNETGARHSFVGTKKECEDEAIEKQKDWGKVDTEVVIERR
jgi:hypothetical protein